MPPIVPLTMVLLCAALAAAVGATALLYLRGLRKVTSVARSGNDGLPEEYYHSRDVCDGPCAIHGPSGHHMVDWPRSFHPDNGIFERRCEHGQWHPDPDSVARFERVLGGGEGWGAGVHTCSCRCCAPPSGDAETPVG